MTRLVGITMRVTPVPSRNERRDALDQAWSAFLMECGLEAVAVPNRHPDPGGYLRRIGAGGVILSGGGNISTVIGTRDGSVPRIAATDLDLAPERDAAETRLLQSSLEAGWPVIGVCRGMQVLNVFHGGAIAAVSGHAGCRHAVTTRAGFACDAEVNSYHDFGIPVSGTAPGFELLADAEGWAEAIANASVRHMGVMWHPERNAPFAARDVAMFRNFFEVAR